jgi:hypothetical protein
MSDPLIDLATATAAALGALLLDKDVSGVDVVEGGLPELVRRGRRERLQLLVEGPLFAVLRERGADNALFEVDLPGGVHLAAGPLLDGRVAVSVRRAAPTDVNLSDLVEEGLVPVGVPDELVAALHLGLGLVVLGPASSARTRLSVAVARAVSKQLRVMALGTDVPAQSVPAPRVAGDDDLVTRARAASALGADVLYAHAVTVVELASLLRASLPVPLLASVAVSNMALLREGLGTLSPLTVGLAAVVGFDPEGCPRLLELHGDSGASSSSPSSSLPSSSSSSSSTLSSVDDDTVAPDDAPPAEWASQDIDDDPGWELGPVQSPSSLPSLLPASTSPPAPGSFDAALQSVARRPSYTPRAPAPHPQHSALRGTGGLTFEAPGGAVMDDGSDDDGSGDDGEP